MYLQAFFGAMLFFILLTLLLKSWKLRPFTLLFAGIFNMIYIFYIFSNEVSSPLPGYLMFDSLGKIIYLGYSLLFLSISVYAVDYLKLRHDRGNRIFIISMIINIITTQIACMSQDLGILWASTEAATLSIAPLIYFNRTKYAIEATWKFILLTSIGIAIALLGIYMIGYAAFQVSGHGTLNILELKHLTILMDSKWLFFSTIFLIIGFSSKMGLAPFHWWKPDAYGEAPGLIGALLSGGLVSLAALCLLRVYQILSPSDIFVYYSNILLVLGIISLFFSAVFITHQNDLKRMLSYS
jgi:hydrogenase-4 component F